MRDKPEDQDVFEFRKELQQEYDDLVWVAEGDELDAKQAEFMAFGPRQKANLSRQAAEQLLRDCAHHGIRLEEKKNGR